MHLYEDSRKPYLKLLARVGAGQVPTDWIPPHKIKYKSSKGSCLFLSFLFYGLLQGSQRSARFEFPDFSRSFSGFTVFQYSLTSWHESDKYRMKIRGKSEEKFRTYKHIAFKNMPRNIWQKSVHLKPHQNSLTFPDSQQKILKYFPWFFLMVGTLLFSFYPFLLPVSICHRVNT